MPAFCLGAATTDAAKRAGWQAHHLGDDAKSLIAALLMSRPTGPLLHIGGVHRRGQVAQTLAGAGLPTTETDVYDQRPDALSQEALEALDGGNPVIVPLFSPRSARQFANQVKGRSALHVLAMSEAVMSEVRDVSATSRQVAQTPNADSMVEALAKLLLRVEAGDTAQ